MLLQQGVACKLYHRHRMQEGVGCVSMLVRLWHTVPSRQRFLTKTAGLPTCRVDVLWLLARFAQLCTCQVVLQVCWGAGATMCRRRCAQHGRGLFLVALTCSVDAR